MKHKALIKRLETTCFGLDPIDPLRLLVDDVVAALAQPAQQEPVADAYTFAEMRFVVCPNCGNKRCPKANDHRNACTNSNEVGQKGSSWEHVKPLAQPEPGRNHYEDGDVFERIAARQKAKQPAPVQQEGVMVGGWGRVATNKLNDLQAKGYAINGVSIATINEAGKTVHGAVTTGGMVLWWNKEQPAPQPEQEPWCMKMNGCKTKCEDCPVEVVEPEQEPKQYQYTWVGLTDPEYIHITDSVYRQGHGLVAYYKAIEAKLKEKNT